MPLQQSTLSQLRQSNNVSQSQSQTTKISHPESTRYHEVTPPSTPRKRRKIDDGRTSPKTQSPRSRGTPRKGVQRDDAELETDQLFRDPDNSADIQVAAILPPVKTDEEAIEAYEAYKAQQAEDTNVTNAPTWVRGRSSIYVDAFNTALETVLETESYLFNKPEHAVFACWRELSYSAQYLYVRLFLRKTSAWHRVSTLGYHGDIQDMSQTVEELQMEHGLPDQTDEPELFPADEKSEQPLGSTFQFMESSHEHIDTLDEASSLLLLDELKVLARDAKVKGKNKQELLRNFRSTSGKQKGLSFHRTDTEGSNVSNDMDDSVSDHQDGSESGRSTPAINRDEHYTKRILETTGECVRLSLIPFQLFERVQLVYHRSTEWSPSSLTAIILASIGRWNFPSYIVCRTGIFSSRSMLLEYTASMRTQFRIDNAIEFSRMPPSRLVEFLKGIFDTVYPRWKIMLEIEGKKEKKYDCGEGAYFRRFSPGWIYTRLVHKTLWALARMKEYVREREILIELLDQRLFAAARRGAWYCRKALIEQRYYDIIDQSDRDVQARKRNWTRVALETCEAGLQDNETHLIYHYDLQKRIKKLEKTLKIPRRQQHDFGHAGLLKALDRTIDGIQIFEDQTPDRTLQRADSSGFKRATTPTRRSGKTIWLDELDTNEHVSVEAFALSYYRKKHGYKGYHSEGSVLRCLFGLLFYDVMFSSYLPGSFQHAYQTAPLDLHTDAFYSARIFEINRRINELAEPGKARSIILDMWNTHREKKTMIIGVRWEQYELDDLLELCDCFTCDGSGKLGVVMRLLAEDYGARGGGVPDLCLWLPAADGKGKVMFSEVKSENDRLSDTQRLWISVLLNAQIPVEVCHVLPREVAS